MGGTGNDGTCPRCGYPRAPADVFCARCGSDLSPLNAAESTPAHAAVTPDLAPPAWPPQVAATTPQDSAGPPRPVAPAPSGRGAKIALLVAAVVVVAAGVPTAFFLLTRSGEEERPAAAKPPQAVAPETTTPAAIGAPLVVEGVEVELTSAQFQDTWTSEFGGDTILPTGPNDSLLVVEAIADGDVETVHEWSVTVSDQLGVAAGPSVTESTVTKGEATGNVTWVFSVSEDRGPFTLNLPGAEAVDLQPLLGLP